MNKIIDTDTWLLIRFILLTNQLADDLAELNQRYHEMALLNEMSEVLQATTTSESAYVPIKTYGQKILPYETGILYIMHASCNYLEVAAAWGKNQARARLFSPEECWALRRNQIHTVNNSESNIICAHVPTTEKICLPYMCVPLTANNETVGLLYLEEPTTAILNGTPVQNEHFRLLISTAEKQISLGLANIKLRETLRHLSIRDPLTGLYNRRYLEETLKREFDRADRKKISLAMIMIDIDHFKQFNDTFGHEAGDYVLQSIGKTFQDQTRASDIVCRYGGEEFLIFMYDTELKNAKIFAEKIQRSVQQLTLQYGTESLGNVTISQGIAIFPHDGTTPHTLIEAADHALYQAKKLGRNLIVVA